MNRAYKKLISNPDEYYRKLFAIGWLDEWTDEEMDVLHKALKENAKDSPEYTVFSLSEYTLDPEGICNPEAYKTAFINLFTAFGIAIGYEDINASAEGDKISIFIKTPLKTAQWLFVQTDDWMHEDFIDFINDELLPDWDEGKVFHPLPPASQNLELVFHYPDIIEDAITAGIIPDDNTFI